MTPAPLMNQDGRRALAFAAIVGGCIVMTLFAAVGVYLVSGDVRLSFYLALAAHFQILVGLTALGALLVKRTIKASKDGFEITDGDTIQSGDQVTIKKEGE